MKTQKNARWVVVLSFVLLVGILAACSPTASVAPPSVAPVPVVQQDDTLITFLDQKVQELAHVVANLQAENQSLQTKNQELESRLAETSALLNSRLGSVEDQVQDRPTYDYLEIVLHQAGNQVREDVFLMESGVVMLLDANEIVCKSLTIKEETTQIGNSPFYTVKLLNGVISGYWNGLPWNFEASVGDQAEIFLTDQYTDTDGIPDLAVKVWPSFGIDVNSYAPAEHQILIEGN